MLDRRKELKLAYKQTALPMGVYQIKNNTNGRIFIGSSSNLPGIFNRHRFQLNAKTHSNKELQEDWDICHSHAFTFDILEMIKSEEIPQDDWSKAIAALEDRWLNKLQPYGEKGYNKKKVSRGTIL
jgi:hypothetical protein